MCLQALFLSLCQMCLQALLLSFKFALSGRMYDCQDASWQQVAPAACREDLREARPFCVKLAGTGVTSLPDLFQWSLPISPAGHVKCCNFAALVGRNPLIQGLLHYCVYLWTR
eukprot:jgi/Botrbrau1/8515/Bobra.0029s0019.1